MPWKEFKQATSRKLASEGDSFFGDYTRHLLAQLNSATFLQFLERLTGIDGLIPDPYFFGGGLHQIEPDGFLKVHVDFNRHETLHVDRRLNAIIYLNKDWDAVVRRARSSSGTRDDKAVQSVLPIFNRCVIFSTQGAFNHGHPEPLACPPDRTRRSLALFYYRNDLAGDETLSEDHDSRYRERPGERIRSGRTTIKRITPPIIFDAARSVGRRFRKQSDRASVLRVVRARKNSAQPGCPACGRHSAAVAEESVVKWKVPLSDLLVDGEILEAIDDAAASGWWSTGPRVEEFEEAVASYMRCVMPSPSRAAPRPFTSLCWHRGADRATRSSFPR